MCFGASSVAVDEDDDEEEEDVTSKEVKKAQIFCIIEQMFEQIGTLLLSLGKFSDCCFDVALTVSGFLKMCSCKVSSELCS